jgi:hypothetical protein
MGEERGNREERLGRRSKVELEFWKVKRSGTRMKN